MNSWALTALLLILALQGGAQAAEKPMAAGRFGTATVYVPDGAPP